MISLKTAALGLTLLALNSGDAAEQCQKTEVLNRTNR